MQQRKDEIAAKRARLEELKRLREERNKEFASSRQSIGVPSEAASTRSETREDLDTFITSLIGDDRRARDSLSATRSSINGAIIPSRSPAPAEGAHEEAQVPARDSAGQGNPQTFTFAPLRTVYEIVSDPPKKETITYSKGVQTSDAWTDGRRRRDSVADDGDDFTQGRDANRADRLRDRLRKEIEQEVLTAQNVKAATDEEAKRKAIREVQALNDQQASDLLTSHDFVNFLERSTKVAERALDEDYDVLADYRTTRQLDLYQDLLGQGKTGGSIRELAQYYDERWSKKRMITDLDFSPKFSELVLASYTKSPASPYDPDGLLMVWNQHMPSRPEYRFQANSDVLTARFSPFHPNLIFGGTYSGQVLLWDTRSRSPTAVQSTPLTMLNSHSTFAPDAPRAAGHTSPVYSLNFTGTQAAYSILSTSTDGTLCAWAPDMLTQPSERLHLLDPHPRSVLHPAYDLAPTCLATPVSSSAESHALVGTEQGGLYLVHRQDRAGGAAKAGIDPRVLFAGHAAPIMSIDFHKAVGPLDLSDLALSAGLDWSIKLWRVREVSDIASTLSPIEDTFGRPISRSRPTTSSSRGAPYGNYTNGTKIPSQAPLLDIPKDDAIYDVKWSPARPAIFATVDGGGALEIYDLNDNVEIPVARTWVSDHPDYNSTPNTVAVAHITNITSTSTLDTKLAPTTAGPPPGFRGNSLNKCAWEQSEGRRIVVGGLDGVVTLFEVGEKLGGRKGAKVGEWEAVRRLVGRCEGRGWR